MRDRVYRYLKLMQNPEAARKSWPTAPLPDAGTGAQPQQAPQGGSGPSPTGASLEAFLQPQEGDFDPERNFDVMGGKAPQTMADAAATDRFADGMRRRRLAAERAAERAAEAPKRGGLTW